MCNVRNMKIEEKYKHQIVEGLIVFVIIALTMGFAAFMVYLRN